MLLLTSTSDKIQLITSAAITIDVHASYVDKDASDVITPGRKNTAVTTATTTDIVASPTGTNARNVKALHIRNKHASTSNTVTVVHTDGTTVVELLKCTLLAGEELMFREGTWFVYDTSGGVKGSGSPSTYVNPSINDFRLTGVSATPIMTADSTTLSTIYLAQFRGNRIALNDGTNWQLAMPASETSLAVTGRTIDLPFDIFAYLSSGVVTLEFLNWTNATTRATGLTRVDGVWTKTGDPSRRYLGSCRARTATTFHFVRSGVDLPCKFDLWNSDNREEHSFTLIASTNTWNYTLATWRQAQASVNYQVDLMVGLQEEIFEAVLTVTATNSTISISRNVGIGFDTTTAFTGICGENTNTVASIPSACIANLAHQPTIGRHFYAWNEISTATGTCTWWGDNGALRAQSGMSGIWVC